ncbi:ADP-ribosylation/Crystallin J1 [Stanieria cyanosphaera PCC 7437]|uniref:ADP-ribosylation/Crystallin J1 n=1 Tax=Stanieria cyanosphaera (strain ATCC 29371 / PCC 7437) TaxID=111780 RepID=K9Y095_STAC7|nr:ADP-ribosylglycohydrolase family protein [Stanieria cyanosphaera]AFZ37714.1 ADP-ribosylation/Crystallin J1 [Stanieria cyanosphaera PCC 7437]
MNRYSLLNRFQGAWLGSAIGKALTSNLQASDWQKITYAQASEGMLAGEKIAQILCNCERIEQLDWQKIALELELEKLSHCSEEVICAVLPLVLLCHDNLYLFKEQWQRLSFFAHHCIEVKEAIYFFSKAIALILREKLNFTDGFDSIILDVGEPRAFLVKRLNQALILSSQGKSLQEVVEELDQEDQSHPMQNAIALAWYCFQSSPENFSLCIRRAMNTGSQCLTVVVLTGALAGAYNGRTGIPLSWRLASQNNGCYRRLEQESQRLLATWLGMYQPNLETISTSIVAAAGVIQPRASLKIISQQEQPT